MPRERRKPLGAIAAALGAVALGLVLWRAAAPPAGPVEPAWDRVACVRCHMLLTDPAYAAQLHTPTGEVLFFDDPGCLLLHRAEPGAAPAAVWFHDSTGDGWLAEADVRFVPVRETPMGHGFAAVAAGSAAEALDAAAALAAIRAREAGAP
jgi:copper chaperone NosL